MADILRALEQRGCSKSNAIPGHARIYKQPVQFLSVFILVGARSFIWQRARLTRAESIRLSSSSPSNPYTVTWLRSSLRMIVFRISHPDVTSSSVLLTLSEHTVGNKFRLYLCTAERSVSPENAGAGLCCSGYPQPSAVSILNFRLSFDHQIMVNIDKAVHQTADGHTRLKG